MTEPEQLFLEKPFAEIRRIDRHNVTKNGLRCYRYDPDGIMVQIRSHTAKQGQIANVLITLAEARQFADFLFGLAGEG